MEADLTGCSRRELPHRVAGVLESTGGDAAGKVRYLPILSIHPLILTTRIALTIDSNGQVTATWWEAKSDGTQSERVYVRRFTNALAPLDTLPQQVDAPPGAPLGVDRAVFPSVATDGSGNVLVSWQGNVNAADALTFSGFGKSFAANGSQQKADFRVDLAGRAYVATLRVARSSQAKSFVATWRDNRTGHFDVYTRVVAALP